MSRETRCNGSIPAIGNHFFYPAICLRNKMRQILFRILAGLSKGFFNTPSHFGSGEKPENKAGLPNRQRKNYITRRHRPTE